MKVEKEGQNDAVIFVSLYLANLLILPVIAFIVLLVLFAKKHNHLPVLAEAHLEQTVSAGMWIMVVFVLALTSVLMMTHLGIEDAAIWVTAGLVFSIIHASMVIIGMVGLAKALSGKCWRFPLVGQKLPSGCVE